MITDINQLDLSKKYTYADYLNWQFDDFVELIRGRLFKMSPAPNTQHQRIAARLNAIIWNQLQNKSCEVFSAPFDVRIPQLDSSKPNISIDTVVQPDICVICDPSKIDLQGCNGAPDWIIEILSKNTASKDLTEKYSLYESAGVKEYWVADPVNGTVIVYCLSIDGRYDLLRPNPFVAPEKIPVGILEGLEIDLAIVFA